VNCVEIAVQQLAFMNRVNFSFHNMKFLDQLNNYQLSKMDPVPQN